jgi:hypothetical protein
MTASTITAPRRVAAVRASLAFIRDGIDGIDARMQRIRNEPAKGDVYVVGYPQYGLFVLPASKGGLGHVENARLMDAHAAARLTVTNGSGERAIVSTYEHALATSLAQLEEAHVALCKCLQDLYGELADAMVLEEERMLADERLELEAARFAYDHRA